MSCWAAPFRVPLVYPTLRKNERIAAPGVSQIRFQLFLSRTHPRCVVLLGNSHALVAQQNRDSEGRSYRNCRCPIWVDGILGGAEIRESLKVRDWQRAQEIIREWEIENRSISQLTRKSAQEAWKEFLADIEARKLNDSTARKYNVRWELQQEAIQQRTCRGSGAHVHSERLRV